MKDKERLKNYFELMENKGTKNLNATLIVYWILNQKKNVLCFKEFSEKNDKT